MTKTADRYTVVTNSIMCGTDLMYRYDVLDVQTMKKVRSYGTFAGAASDAKKRNLIERTADAIEADDDVALDELQMVLGYDEFRAVRDAAVNVLFYRQYDAQGSK